MWAPCSAFRIQVKINRKAGLESGEEVQVAPEKLRVEVVRMTNPSWSRSGCGTGLGDARMRTAG